MQKRDRLLSQPVPGNTEVGLLDLDLGTLLLESSLDLVGLVLGDALLDRLGGRVNEILRLLETQAGQLAHDLDDRDLVGADVGQHCAELALLLSTGSGRGATGSTTGGRRSSGGNRRSG